MSAEAAAMERTCAHHLDAPAVARCTRCGVEICGGCHGVRLQGFAVCRPCRGIPLVAPIPWEEEEPGPTAAGYVQTAVQALMSPQTFFLGMRLEERAWGTAAVYGVICITLGLIVSNLWEKAFSPEYAEAMAGHAGTLGLSLPMTEVALFAMVPFGAVVLYFLHTALLYSSLKIFGVSQATWGQTARISGFALTAYLLLFVPPAGSFELGQFFMIFWLFNLEVGAVRWVFRTGFFKSMGIVLVPLMLFLMTI